jgi:hypothetical protein
MVPKTNRKDIIAARLGSPATNSFLLRPGRYRLP